MNFRKKDDNDLWDPSWEDNDASFPDTLSRPKHRAAATYTTFDTSYDDMDDDMIEREPRRRWGLILGGFFTALIMLIFIVGGFTTRYSANGKAVLETPKYRDRLHYVERVITIWNDAKQTDAKAQDETTAYLKKGGNPFSLSKSLTKEEKKLTTDYEALNRLSVPQEYQPFQTTLLDIVQMSIQRMDGESKLITSSNSPNLSTVISAQKTFNQEKSVIQKQLKQMKYLFNISN